MGFSEKIRLEVLQRAHFSCCICKIIGPAEVHHIIPHATNGPDSKDNAAPLCPTCHETYGANPTKRKFIRDVRDHWYDICSKKYKADENLESRLIALIKKVDTKVDTIQKGIVKNLTSQGGPQPGKPLPIGQVTARLVDQRFDGNAISETSIMTTYQLLFQTEGDQSVEFDREFNETRGIFEKQFGKIVAEAICAHLIRRHNLDWTKGVTEPELTKVYNQSFILMIILLQHEDFGKNFKIRISFDADGTLRGTAVNDDGKKKTDSDTPST